MQLGERMDVVAFAIKGKTMRGDSVDLMDAIVSILKMKKAHDAVEYHYPINGAGGMGFTRIQPITESFIAFDAWPDFGGAYLIICSCKTICLSKVTKKIRALGYKINKISANELRLKNGF